MATLFVIAGPNGIGKTTSSYDIVPQNTPLINSDEIAKEIRSAGLINANTQEYSNREAIRLMNEQIEHNNTFAIETNLSDLDTWKFLLEIQKKGYQLHVIYMSTDSLEVLNSRIQERTKLGDHYVKPEIVEQRYTAGLKLLNHYFHHPDKIQLFDNSTEIILVAEINKGQILRISEELPDWVRKILPGDNETSKGPAIRSLKNIEDVRKAYEKLANQKK